MKASTKNQVKGKLREVKGSLKKKAGDIIDSPGLQIEGQIEKTAGKVQEKVGVFERFLEEQEARAAAEREERAREQANCHRPGKVQQE